MFKHGSIKSIAYVVLLAGTNAAQSSELAKQTTSKQATQNTQSALTSQSSSSSSSSVAHDTSAETKSLAELTSAVINPQKSVCSIVYHIDKNVMEALNKRRRAESEIVQGLKKSYPLVPDLIFKKLNSESVICKETESGGFALDKRGLYMIAAFNEVVPLLNNDMKKYEVQFKQEYAYLAEEDISNIVGSIRLHVITDTIHGLANKILENDHCSVLHSGGYREWLCYKQCIKCSKANAEIHTPRDYCCYMSLVRWINDACNSTEQLSDSSEKGILSKITDIELIYAQAQKNESNPDKKSNTEGSV